MNNKIMIEQYMRKIYRLPKWALFFEVPDKLGMHSTRRADAIAVGMNLPHKILGFEFKTNRSDWLKELKSPEKSACFAEKCNEFYIVAPADVVYYDEIPEPYGWINPDCIFPSKKSAKFNVDFDIDFMFVLLRRSALIAEKYAKIYDIITSPVYDTRMFDLLQEGDQP
jgi:hypothetical protein